MRDPDLRWAWVPALAVIAALAFVVYARRATPATQSLGTPDPVPQIDPGDASTEGSPTPFGEAAEELYPFVGDLAGDEREGAAAALSLREGVEVALLGSAREDERVALVYGLDTLELWQAEHERAGDWEETEARIEAAVAECDDAANEVAAARGDAIDAACDRAERTGSEADQEDCQMLQDMEVDEPNVPGWECGTIGHDEVFPGSFVTAQNCGDHAQISVAGAERLASGAWRILWSRTIDTRGDGCPSLEALSFLANQVAVVWRGEIVEDHGIDNEQVCGDTRTLQLVAPDGDTETHVDLAPDYEEIDDDCDGDGYVAVNRVVLDDADGLRLRSLRSVLDHERCSCDDAVALVDDSSAGHFSDGGAICLPFYQPYEPPGPCEAPEETSREVRFDPETGWPPAD